MTHTAGEHLIELIDQHPEKKDEIIRFCSINSATFRMWLTGRSPKGLRQAKLFIYLIQHGRKSAELGRTNLDILRLMALVATDGVSPENAMSTALGSTAGGPQQLWKYFRGDNAPHADAQARLRIWLAEKSDEASETREQQADQLLEPSREVPVLQLATPAPGAVPPAHADLIAANLAALLSAAFPLAKRLESDDFTDEDRQRFRDAIGEDQFFALSNALTRLSGAQARSMTRPTSA